MTELESLKQENVLLREALEKIKEGTGQTSWTDKLLAGNYLTSVPLTTKAQRIVELEKKVVEAARAIEGILDTLSEHQMYSGYKNEFLVLEDAIENLNAEETI